MAELLVCCQGKEDLDFPHSKKYKHFYEMLETYHTKMIDDDKKSFWFSDF